MTPDLNIASRPCLCMERFCRVPMAPLIESVSLVLDMSLTICGEFIMAELEDHHGRLGHDHLVLVVQQLGNGPGGQVSVVLVVDE